MRKLTFNGFRETSPYYLGKMDLWYGFACFGIDLLCTNGHLCFIAQNNWTTSAGAKKMRNKILSDIKIKQLIDFNAFMVFESASIQTMIMLFEKNKENGKYTFDYRRLKGEATQKDLFALLGSQPANAEYLFPSIDKELLLNKTFTFAANDTLFTKISSNRDFLSDKEATNGIHTHHDCVNNKINENYPDLPVGKGIFVLSSEELELLHLNEQESKIVKPFYDSRQIHRFFVEKDNSNWIIYTDSSYKNGTKIRLYPNLKKHLDSVAKAITSDNKPYGLHRSREEHFFKGEKIIVQRKCVDKPIFAYCDFDCYVSATYYVIQTDRWNMKFLTGLLNSKLITYWLKNKGKMQGTNFQIDKEPLLGIPLPIPESIPKEKEQRIVNLVDSILEKNQICKEADITAEEREINDLIYDIYHVSEDEILEIDNP